MSRRLTGAITEDDHTGFGRPPRRTRPRTKDRPDYSGARQIPAFDGWFLERFGVKRRIEVTSGRRKRR